jgi:hypothetical protein
MPAGWQHRREEAVAGLRSAAAISSPSSPCCATALLHHLVAVACVQHKSVSMARAAAACCAAFTAVARLKKPLKRACAAYNSRWLPKLASAGGEHGRYERHG